MIELIKIIELSKELVNSEWLGIIRRDPPSSCYLYDLPFDIRDRESFYTFLDYVAGCNLAIYKRHISNISNSKNCPWCFEKTSHLREHIKVHDKGHFNWQSYKVQLDLYKVLLHNYWRKGIWQAFGLLPFGCQLCADTKILWNGKRNVSPLRCVRADSPKNRMRDLRVFGLNYREFLEVPSVGFGNGAEYYGFILFPKGVARDGGI